jgi:tetratricopeptide (TPR) repeat protein
MALRGSLNEVNLADICQLLALGRKRGCLWITDRQNFGYIYFDAGRVTYASVLNRPDRLGELLVQNGVISRDQLSTAMEQQSRDPLSRLGRILVSQGSLTEDDLKHYVELQVSEAVYHLFAWKQGSFHFDPDQVPEEEEAYLISINAENLLLEGARRVDEWSMIEKRVPSFDLVFGVSKWPEGDEVELTEDQQKVMRALDGSRSVNDVVRETGLVEFTVGRALYGLLQAGFVEQLGRKEGAAPESFEDRIARHRKLGRAFERTGLLEDAAREYRRVVELDPEQAKPRHHLAMIALRSRRPEDALEHFGALPAGHQTRYAVLRHKALALELLGRYEEALQVLDVSESARPKDADVFLARGIVLLKSGDPHAASDAFVRYRERLGGRIPPPMFYAYSVLGAAMEGRLEEAVSLGREGLAHYPDSGAILVNTGAVLQHLGEPEASEAIYRRAAESEEPPPQAYKSLGDLALLRGDLGDARAHYQRALGLDPDLGDDVYLKLGNLAHQDADERTAMQFWEKALELNPENRVAARSLEARAPVPA